jgi:hypothetical protein
VFNRIKKSLGMVGMTVEIIAPNMIARDDPKIEGVVRITAKTTQEVERVIVRLMRQRVGYDSDGDRDTDTDELTRTEIPGEFTIGDGEFREVPFTLYFEGVNREMFDGAIDALKEKGGLMGAMGGLMESMADRADRSTTYYLTAVVDLKGVLLDPSDRHPIMLG